MAFDAKPDGVQQVLVRVPAQTVDNAFANRIHDSVLVLA